MSPRFDIQLQENDVILSGNDLVWGVSDEQHIQDTINAHPGWWMENFSDGVGIRDFLNSSGQQQVLARRIKIQLESDLYSVTNPLVKIEGSKLTIQPNAI